MQHITKTKDYTTDLSPLLGLTGYERPLFLDIETTGLSSERNHIYLIGCCYPEGSSWQFHQWFSESPEEEAQILREFLDILPEFTGLVHFNGSTFDIPFILKRCEKLGIPCPLEDFPSLDFFREIRPCKNLLDLPNLKQKTIENLLGIFRQDTMTGGDLIAVYRKYVKSPDPEAAHLLLLHNEEDILDMPRLLPILLYREAALGHLSVKCIRNIDIQEGLTQPRNMELTQKTEFPKTLSSDLTVPHPMSGQLTLDLEMDLSLPAPIFIKKEDMTCIWKKNILHMTLPLYREEMRFFFEDYRNYYYLPGEDEAIHKSVAEFVDKDFRQKAKKETAYTRRTTLYLPFPASPTCCKKNASPCQLPGKAPFFRRAYGEEPHVDLQTDLKDSPEFWTLYVHHFLTRILQEKG